MIITRTPLRISLVGGGTDSPAFYRHAFGAVVSMAIDKYVYVSVNPKFGGGIRVSYSTTENVKSPLELKHDIIREELLNFNVSGVEVVTVADIPGTGTGLGSSSSLAVGLSNALYRYTNGHGLANPRGIADHAYFIEREQCLHSVGKQDHYAAAYGGLYYFQFEPDDAVLAEPLLLDKRAELESRLVLLWTGRNRKAQDILAAQEANMNTDRYRLVLGMRDLAVQLRDDFRRGDLSNIGAYLHTNWMMKRQLAYGITNEWINMTYDRAIAAGAEGGKICGAGGGGFFVFWGPEGVAPALEKATGLKRVPFKIDTLGSQVIYE